MHRLVRLSFYTIPSFGAGPFRPPLNETGPFWIREWPLFAQATERPICRSTMGESRMTHSDEGRNAESCGSGGRGVRHGLDRFWARVTADQHMLWRNTSLRANWASLNKASPVATRSPTTWPLLRSGAVKPESISASPSRPPPVPADNPAPVALRRGPLRSRAWTQAFPWARARSQLRQFHRRGCPAESVHRS